MASTLTAACPECGKQVTVKAEVEGKKIRCKGCSGVFKVTAESRKGKAGVPSKGKPAETNSARPMDGAVKQPVKPAAGGGPSAADQDDDVTPLTLASTYLGARCPVCANEMAGADAFICLHCGFNTRTRQAVKTKKLYETTAQDRLRWLAPGIAAAIGIPLMLLVWYLYHFAMPYWFFGKMWDKALELPEVHGSRNRVAGNDALGNDSFYSYLFHYGIEMWLDIFLIFLAYKFFRFALKRLIFEPTPPEKEKR